MNMLSVELHEHVECAVNAAVYITFIKTVVD